MIERRVSLIQKHASSHTTRVLFEQLGLLPKGTLMSVAQTRGLFFKNPTNDSPRQAISHHAGMGKCVGHEGYALFLGCSLVESEFIPPTSEPGTCDDPLVRLQIHILRQLMPILKLRPLRRLLELHDVSYVESDKTKKLCQLMKSYLVRLRSGKYPDKFVGHVRGYYTMDPVVEHIAHIFRTARKIWMKVEGDEEILPRFCPCSPARPSWTFGPAALHIREVGRREQHRLASFAIVEGWRFINRDLQRRV
jgi:hypothetical protein